VAARPVVEAKVATAAGRGVRGEAQDRAEGRAHRKPYSASRSGAVADSANRPEEQAQEHAQPAGRQGARHRRPTAGEPAGHPLDEAQVGADDADGLDGEADVRQVVDDGLGLGVVGVGAQGVAADWQRDGQADVVMRGLPVGL
jgi:hypothetical protein